MKVHHLIIFLSSLLVLCSCGGGDSFTIMTQVEGLGTQNVRAVYHSDGRLKVTPAMALDGKFSIVGASETPVLIDLYTATRGYIGSVVARNGDTVEAQFTLNNPAAMNVKGNKESEEMSKFVKNNAQAFTDRDALAINEAVKQYVIANHTRPASAFILLSMFNPAIDANLADSLLSIIDEKALPPAATITAYRQLLPAATDSTLNLTPFMLYTMGDSMATIETTKSRGLLLAFTTHKDDYERKLAVHNLNFLSDSLKSHARVVEIALDKDTTGLTVDPKARYTVCWEPAAIATPGVSRLGVRQVPWFIVADTTGVITYSGNDLSHALKSL